MSPDADLDASGRFRALVEHEDFAAWMQHTPPSTRIDKRALFALVIGALVVAVFLSGGIATICAPLAIVPMILVGFGIYGLLRQFLEFGKSKQEALERLPLLILDERTAMAGDGVTRARYYHSVELSDGTRRELETSADIIARVRPGKMGIGFVRGGKLIEFARLPV